MKENKEFQIKGISINSPGLLIDENHDFLQDIREIKKLGANAVKVPICPAYFQSIPNYCEDILDKIVNLCEELDLYCCLDWHAQGNVFLGTTREPKNRINGFMKYDAREEIIMNALGELSSRYGKRNNVIFEIFSSPQDISGEKWAGVVKNLVSVIRNNSENLVSVAGINWGTDLSWVLENPIESNNIIYSCIYYNLKNYDCLDILEKVNEKYPVIIPECGYHADGYFGGTKEIYGEKLRKLIMKDGISFFAWCYHVNRFPVVLNSWDPEDLSEWGLFLRDELL